MLIEASTSTTSRMSKQSSPKLSSVDELKPDEEGGPIARAGFDYQDEVAVKFVLLMLNNPLLLKVHCETHDDIVLVWSNSPTSPPLVAEYVQVKSNAPNQLWTVAQLCQRNPKHSVYEKSILKDKCIEISRFRIVTLRQVDKELKVLTMPLGNSARSMQCDDCKALCSAINAKAPGLVSDKGGDVKYWVENCLWEEGVSFKSLKDENLLALLALSTANGHTLLIDQIHKLLDELRSWVHTAGAANWDIDKLKKIITSSQISAWWTNKISDIRDAAAATSGGNLRRKMGSLPAPVLELALEQRRRFSRVARTPRYMQDDNGSRLQDEVFAEVTSLQSKYVAGQLNIDAAAFHQMCVEQVDAIAKRLPGNAESHRGYLQGCLYDIADRCLLDFGRSSS